MAFDSHSDQELVELANAGQPGSFEALYRRHRDWAVNLAYRFLQDRELALDVMQETFVYLLNRFPGFRLEARLTTFLYPVIRHRCLDLLKKRGRSQDALLAEPPAESAEPDSAELCEVLARAVNRLPEAQREAVWLRYGHGLSLEEAAVAQAVPLGTTKSRLHHALAALRQNPRLRNYFEKP